MALPPAAAASPAGGTVLYLAFGANMASGVLAKRGVQPLTSQAAQVADRDAWLSFSHRGGFATLTRTRSRRRRLLPTLGGNAAEQQEAPLQPAWRQPPGVLYTLRLADLQRLAAKEVGYRTAQLEVLTAAGETCTATAFVSSPLLQLYTPAPPRQRYRDLLLEGCRQHGLDPSYTAWLEGLEVVNGPLDSRHGACPADALAKVLAVGALMGAGWLSVSL